MTGNKTRFSISELSRMSGIPISTIKYYIRKKLLPRPAKTSQTMAYYSDADLFRLKIIKKLQAEEGMSLNKIKDIISIMEEGAKKDQMYGQARFMSHKSNIVNSAIDVFRNKGYEKATIADIVGAANIGRGTFYKYFKNKKELFIECFQEIYRDVLSMSSAELAEEKDLFAKAGKLFQDFYREYPRWGFLRHMMWTAGIVDPDGFEDEIKKAMQLPTGVIQEHIKQGVKDGDLRDVDIVLASVLVSGAVEKCIEFIEMGLFDIPIEMVSIKMWDIFYNGIGKR